MAEVEKKKWKHVHKVYNNGGGTYYGFGVIGALFYFIPQSNNLETFIIAVIKSIFWPAVVAYKLFELLKL